MFFIKKNQMIKSKKENKSKKECQHELTFQTYDLGD